MHKNFSNITLYEPQKLLENEALCSERQFIDVFSAEFDGYLSSMQKLAFLPNGFILMAVPIKELGASNEENTL